MSLSFLPDAVKNSVAHLNFNMLSEIRLRRGQPVIIEYGGAYRYLGVAGLSAGINDRVFADDVTQVLNAATRGSLYGYTEQMKSGFITVEHGVRIGIAGEYVTERGAVNAIKNVTSLNVRVPHDVRGCGSAVCGLIEKELKSVLIFSKPGLGKTTMLRDVARRLSGQSFYNVLVLDERNEIAAMDGFGDGFDLGTADVVRCFNKLGAIVSAIRAMKPDVIITDELYGADDMRAVGYARDCGISVVASSHVTDRKILKEAPFDYYAEIKMLCGQPVIYDKDFNTFSDNRADNFHRGISFG